jgi:hypothetical protein
MSAPTRSRADASDLDVSRIHMHSANFDSRLSRRSYKRKRQISEKCLLTWEVGSKKEEL